MEIHELKNLVDEGEGLRLEFKLKLPEFPKLAREISAFANTRGGKLLIGVADDGTISGIRDPREIVETLGLHLEKYLSPFPQMSISVIPVNRKKGVIQLHVPESAIKPVLALEEGKKRKGTALIRLGESSTAASREMYELLRFYGNERDTKVHYGEKESILMKMLEEKSCVTVSHFAETAGIKKFVASRTLVHLAKAGILEIEPQLADEDIFRRKMGDQP